ncbi:MAG: hypothetical protein ACREV5_15880 [Steroidobacter sp.]
MDDDSERHQWRCAARRALVSGSAASVSSGVALSVCSKIDEDAPAGALNGPSQWLRGEEEAHTRQATAKHTAVGYAIHHGMSIFWATLHERTFGCERKSVARHCLEAGATSATAYVVDYYLTPPRFRPGFRKHLKPRSMFAAYAAFATGLAAAAIVRDRGMNSGSTTQASRLSSSSSWPASTCRSASSQSSSSWPGVKPRRSARQ